MKSLCLLLTALCYSFITLAQNVQFADVDDRDNQQMNFEIIGKLKNNLLIYKEVKNQKRITVYDDGMHVIVDKALDFIPSKASLIDLSFFQNGDKANMIYQFQAGNIVYCVASIINADGESIGEPIVLDTTQIDYLSKGKVYNYMTNENGSRIGIFKINKKDKKNQVFSIDVYNAALVRQGSSVFTIHMADAGDFLANYVLTNDGTFAFIKYNREKSGVIQKVHLVQNKLGDTKVFGTDLNVENKFLDDIKLKIDEKNNRFLVSSLYADKKKGKINGIFTAGFEKMSGKNLFVHVTPVQIQSKSSKTANSKALDDHFINHFIVNDDGTFTIVSEVASSNYNYMGMYNSFYGGLGYWGSPWGMWGPGWYGMPHYHWGFTPWSGYWGGWGYYSPFFYRSYWWGSYWPDDRRSINYKNGNIAVFNFDKTGILSSKNMIFKNQQSSNTDATLSYQMIENKKDIGFVFNKSKKLDELVKITVDEDGKINEQNMVTAKNKNMSFMPKYAKRLNGTLIVPYLQKNNISFVKIEL
ncbi:MAG: hypothetical protein E6Q95_01450 [Chitinophagaceae bacterium]|nr:MAG: hypothetical protein E6Q95_01450 [Chitinophagaceae bacterium]